MRGIVVCFSFLLGSFALGNTSNLFAYPGQVDDFRLVPVRADYPVEGGVFLAERFPPFTYNFLHRVLQRKRRSLLQWQYDPSSPMTSGVLIGGTLLTEGVFWLCSPYEYPDAAGIHYEGTIFVLTTSYVRSRSSSCWGRSQEWHIQDEDGRPLFCEGPVPVGKQVFLQIHASNQNDCRLEKLLIDLMEKNPFAIQGPGQARFFGSPRTETRQLCGLYVHVSVPATRSFDDSLTIFLRSHPDWRSENHEDGHIFFYLFPVTSSL
jgi:hypothetical protein